MTSAPENLVAELVKANERFVHALALRFAPAPGLAEDVAQQVFLEFISKAAEWDLTKDIKPLLAVMTRHVANRCWRERMRSLPEAATSHVAHLDVDPAFTKITTGSIVTDLGTGTACAWVDYDNAGNLDLFVTTSDGNGFASQNELFRNNGDGTLTKMTSARVGAIVPGGGGSEGPVFADYDRDGFVDLYIARYGNDWLYHNNGDGTFTLIPNTNGIPMNYENGYRAMWADYNNDGWPDLFVPVNTPSPCAQLFPYRGLGGGLFTNEVTSTVVSACGSSVGAWGDYDNDGYLDLLRGGPINHLYHNNQDGTFTEMTSNVVGSIVSSIPLLTDCIWGDYDNDGFLDVFLSVLGTPTSPATNRLHHNNREGTFSQVLTGSIANDQTIGTAACAWGDYNNDGFLDLFVPCGSDVFPATNLLYRNNGNSNGWFKIKLIGIASNRSAIGAKVRPQATIWGKSMWQLREISTGSGFSGPPLEAHFGLGDATNIDQVRIEWPSGIVQVLTNVAPKQHLTTVEHQEGKRPTGPSLAGSSNLTNRTVTLTATGDPGWLYVFEASTNLVNWTKIGVRSNAIGRVSFLEPSATNYARRFYRVSIP